MNISNTYNVVRNFYVLSNRLLSNIYIAKYKGDIYNKVYNGATHCLQIEKIRMNCLI